MSSFNPNRFKTPQFNMPKFGPGTGGPRRSMGNPMSVADLAKTRDTKGAAGPGVGSAMTINQVGGMPGSIPQSQPGAGAGAPPPTPPGMDGTQGYHTYPGSAGPDDVQPWYPEEDEPEELTDEEWEERRRRQSLMRMATRPISAAMASYATGTDVTIPDPPRETIETGNFGGQPMEIPGVRMPPEQEAEMREKIRIGTTPLPAAYYENLGTEGEPPQEAIPASGQEWEDRFDMPTMDTASDVNKERLKREEEYRKEIQELMRRTNAQGRQQTAATQQRYGYSIGGGAAGYLGQQSENELKDIELRALAGLSDKERAIYLDEMKEQQRLDEGEIRRDISAGLDKLDSDEMNLFGEFMIETGLSQDYSLQEVYDKFELEMGNPPTRAQAAALRKHWMDLPKTGMSDEEKRLNYEKRLTDLRSYDEWRYPDGDAPEDGEAPTRRPAGGEGTSAPDDVDPEDRTPAPTPAEESDANFARREELKEEWTDRSWNQPSSQPGAFPMTYSVADVDGDGNLVINVMGSPEGESYTNAYEMEQNLERYQVVMTPAEFEQLIRKQRMGERS